MNSKRSLKEVESNLHGWLWGVQDSSEEVIVDVAETPRELKLEIEPKNVAELMQSCDKTWKDEDLFLIDE